MFNVERYFTSNQRYFLDDIEYQNIRKQGDGQIALNCRDNIKCNVYENEVEILVTRTLKFEPECIFELNVTYGAFVELNKETKNELNWKTFDLARELHENKNQIVDNIVSRISLLISEITASAGQVPLVTPPSIAARNN